VRQVSFDHEPERPRREPAFNLPFVIVALIVVFAGLHVVREYVLTFAQDAEALRTFAFVPGRFLFMLDSDSVIQHLAAGLEGDQRQVQLARFFLGDGSAQPWTILTYAFLHGDFIHVGVNSLWLIVFGAPVARRFGVSRFLLFFAVTAIAGALVHFVLHRHDFTPVVGASAAVSGAMAAALRFVFQPGGPLGPHVGGLRLPPDLAARLPALPLREVLRDRRVMQFTAIWFVINLAFGLFSVTLGATASAVAWEAHVGGFVAGFLLFPLFDPPPPGPEEFAPYMPVSRFARF